MANTSALAAALQQLSQVRDDLQTVLETANPSDTPPNGESRGERSHGFVIPSKGAWGCDIAPLPPAMAALLLTAFVRKGWASL